MKRIIPAVFVIVAALLAYFALSQKALQPKQELSRAKVVTPVVNSGEEDKLQDRHDYEDSAQTSFIRLSHNETLLNVVGMDIDADGYDDQINIVKTSTSPYVQLIFALYNPEKSEYERAARIETNITQSRTFVCTSLDVIGNHTNAILYQGSAENGHQVLKIYTCKKTRKGNFELELIGDFDTDGTAFIQQTDRDESYSLSQAKGESFPVWVYSSDPNSAGTDQIQTEYVYSEKEKKYLASRIIRVTGSRLAAKELERIQDGTVETFSKFLDGLWYKVDNSAGGIRYVFFDNTAGEVVFEYQDSEEVYLWNNRRIRRNGMYFSSVNQSIENLQRRCDISLLGIDEIRLRIQDDVRMIISESNLWDGNYKKMSMSSVTAKAEKVKNSEIFEDLRKGPAWTGSDGSYIVFSKNTFTRQNGSESEFGQYNLFTISKNQLIQFRPTAENPYFSGAYSIAYEHRSNSSDGKSSDDQTLDKNTILLQPVIVNPDGFYATESRPIVLKRTALKKADN